MLRISFVYQSWHYYCVIISLCTDFSLIVHGFDVTEIRSHEGDVAVNRMFKLFVKGNTTDILPTRMGLPGSINSMPITAVGKFTVRKNCEVPTNLQLCHSL